MKSQARLPSLFKRALFSFVLISLLCFSALGARAFCLSLTPQATQTLSNVTLQPYEVYFLTIAKSQISSSAKALACDYQASGHAGYLLENEGYYHVISNAYLNLNDAELVKSAAASEGVELSLITLSFEGASLDLEIENTKIVTKALRATIATFETLFDIALSLDTGVYDELSAALAVNSCFSALTSTQKDFETIRQGLDEEEQYALEEVSDQLTLLLSVVGTLSTGEKICPNQTYSSLIKYRYCELLFV